MTSASTGCFSATVARLFPDSLDAAEQQRWEEERQRRLVSDPELASIRWPEFQAEIAERLAAQPEHLDILEALAQWGESLGLRKPGLNPVFNDLAVYLEPLS